MYLLGIRFITLTLNFALYYFQITFSSFELVICYPKLSKPCFLWDFKCFLPRNLIESLISFGIWWINLPWAWSWVPSSERFYAKGVTKSLLPASGGILWRFLLTYAPYPSMLRKGSKGGGDYETNTITSVNMSYTYTCNTICDL